VAASHSRPGHFLIASHLLPELVHDAKLFARLQTMSKHLLDVDPPSDQTARWETSYSPRGPKLFAVRLRS
jgi:hypothetical protein